MTNKTIANQAVQFAEVVMLAVPWLALEDALKAAGSLALEGKVLITCVSGLRPDWEGQKMGLPTDLISSVAEMIAQLVPGVKVVEAFNATFAEILKLESRQFGSERSSVLYCGDDTAAKVIVAGLIEECGYEAVDAGPLIRARSLELLGITGYRQRLSPACFLTLGLIGV